MKIALVSPYDFAYPGGVTNHISALERQFTRMGHQVTVIAPASKAITSFGDRFVAIGKPRPIPASGSIARVTISLHLAPTIKRVLSRENFDIVHLHEPFMPMLCSAVLRFSHAVNIGTFHAARGKPGYNFGWPVSRWMLKRRANKLHGRIAVSEPAAEFARKYVPGDYGIIPNGVDFKHFSAEAPPIEQFCDGKLNILFVGRLEKRKGLDYLLRAFQQVKKEMPNCRLIIVGPGTRLRKKYEKQVRRKRLEDVAFTGAASQEELPRYYQTADVFCSPATGRESFGLVLLEAMASGKPVVASNIEGYARIVNHGVDGLLVPPKDGKALAQALLSLLINPSLRQRMGTMGQQKARGYDWADIAQRVLDYYYEVLGRSSQKRTPMKTGVTSRVG